MKTAKFSDIFLFAPKSKIKAGDGLDKGRFPFYTSSPILSKYYHTEQYFDEALIFGTGGSASIHYSDEPFSTSTDCLVAIVTNKNFNTKFVYYYLFSNFHILERGFKGAGLKHISKKYIQNIDIPVIDIETQNRIVANLDQANHLIKKKREVYNEFLKLKLSFFVSMFGDPIKNPNGWPTKTIDEVSEILRDGPFGSNLKTEHYRDSGVRVIRLQNINPDDFNNIDQAYISDEHYQTIVNHTCLPGDVLIGTLGEPNLRSCLFPKNMDKAVNKADCVQLRPNKEFILDQYINAFLNHPAALFAVKNFIKGQTRSRISKGLLAKISIPVPPIELQQEFSNHCQKIEEFKTKLDQSEALARDAFNSISQKVFKTSYGIDLEAELNALLREIDLQKSKNDLFSIITNEEYLLSLVNRLNNQEFESQDLYDKAKHAAFQLLKTEEIITQVYDTPSRSLKLALK